VWFTLMGRNGVPSAMGVKVLLQNIHNIIMQ
jgi:hypothetical protein